MDKSKRIKHSNTCNICNENDDLQHLLFCYKIHEIFLPYHCTNCWKGLTNFDIKDLNNLKKYFLFGYPENNNKIKFSINVFY